MTSKMASTDGINNDKKSFLPDCKVLAELSQRCESGEWTERLVAENRRKVRAQSQVASFGPREKELGAKVKAAGQRRTGGFTGRIELTSNAEIHQQNWGLVTVAVQI